MRAPMAAVALFVAWPAFAAEPFARASIEQSDQFVTGEQVFMTVDVFAPDFFTSPPQFPLFDVAGAMVTLPDERAQNLMQTIDGVQYSGIRRRYAIIPQAAGTFEVPSVDIALGYSADGKSVSTDVMTGSLSFSVQSAGSGIAFAASEVTITQAFDRDPGSLKVGDALVRTITVSAQGTQALLMPPVETGAADGLAQYVKPAKIEDGVKIGRDLESRRTETTVYTALTAGNFVVPAVRYDWFDVTTRKAAEADLAATTVIVTAAATKAGIAPEIRPKSKTTAVERRQRIAAAIAAVFVLLALGWGARRLPGHVVRLCRQTRDGLAASRWNQLRLLRKTIRTADPLTVYGALLNWAHRERSRTLEEWSQRQHPDVRLEVAQLGASLFGSVPQPVDRQKLSALVGRTDTITASRQARLPPLNPAGEP